MEIAPLQTPCTGMGVAHTVGLDWKLQKHMNTNTYLLTLRVDKLTTAINGPTTTLMRLCMNARRTTVSPLHTVRALVLNSGFNIGCSRDTKIDMRKKGQVLRQSITCFNSGRF